MESEGESAWIQLSYLLGAALAWPLLRSEALQTVSLCIPRLHRALGTLEQEGCDVARLLSDPCCRKFSYPALCIIKSTGLGPGQ